MMLEALYNGSSLDGHWSQLVLLACLLIVEVAVRVAPSKVDRSIVNLLARMVTLLFDSALPNRTPSGGKFVVRIKSEEQKDE